MSRNLHLIAAASYQRMAHKLWLERGDRVGAEWSYAQARHHLFAALSIPA